MSQLTSIKKPVLKASKSRRIRNYLCNYIDQEMTIPTKKSRWHSLEKKKRNSRNKHKARVGGGLPLQEITQSGGTQNSQDKESSSFLSSNSSGSILSEISDDSSSSSSEALSLSSYENLPSPNQESTFSPVGTDSAVDGKNAFHWMIKPCSVERFFSTYWDTKPLQLERGSEYYKELISIPMIDEVLRTNNLQYSEHILIKRKESDEKNLKTIEGRALPHVVWENYSEKRCSITLLNPQAYFPKLHELIASIQEFFNCFIGAKAHLTPPGEKVGSPEYSTYETFILQVEGKKYWRVFKPSTKHLLPMGNDADGMEPSSRYHSYFNLPRPIIMETTLDPGDLMYIPPGFGYQASGEAEQQHSLYITLSVNRKQTWGDMFKTLISDGLKKAVTEDIELRQSVPLDMFDHFGSSHAKSTRKEEIEKKVSLLFGRIKKSFSIDNAVDQMHKSYQHAAMPPALTSAEKELTVFGVCGHLENDGIVAEKVDITRETEMKLLRRNIMRLVSEDRVYRLYYYTGNSMENHRYPPTFLEIKRSWVLGIMNLVSAYPEYIKVKELDIKESDQIKFMRALWSRGIIMTKHPIIKKIAKN